MASSAFLLSPIDAWFFRDGRSFNRAEGGSAHQESFFFSSVLGSALEGFFFMPRSPPITIVVCRSIGSSGFRKPL